MVPRSTRKNRLQQIRTIMDTQTSKFGKLIIHHSIRKSTGYRRVQYDYSDCPTMAEQHTAKDSDINYLMKKFSPDEVAQYIAARSSHRVEILGHDFSTEPSLMEAKNEVLKIKKMFSELPPEVMRNFQDELDFLKFIDNPANAEKMIKLGLIKKKNLEEIQKNPKTDTEPVKPKEVKSETPKKDQTKPEKA